MKPLIRTYILHRVIKRLGNHSLDVSKAFCVGLLAAFLLNCSTDGDAPDLIAEPTIIRAHDISDARNLHIYNGDCANILRANLSNKGFSLPNDTAADAVLHLHLYQLRPLREGLPIIKTFGAQAKYRADLIGANNTALLSLYGQEGSLSFNELCDDIADELADKLASLLPNAE